MDAEKSRRSFAYQPLGDSPTPRSKPRSRSLTITSTEYSTELSENNPECLVCGEAATLMLEVCRHHFCEDCLKTYVEEETKSRGLVSCPKFGCKEEVSDWTLRRCLDEASFQRYLHLKEETVLESNPNFRWCPKAGCQGYALKTDASSAMVCSLCGLAFCFYCGEDSHSTSRCRAKNNHSLHVWAKRHHAKFCPNCRILVLRSTGCNHMSCSRCNYAWCWLCGFPIAGHQQCQVQEYWLRNPPLYVCLVLLFFPAILPLLFVILLIIFAKNGFGNSLDDWHERSPCSFYSCFISVTLIFTPLLFLVLVMGAGLLLCEVYRSVRSGSTEVKFGRCLFDMSLSVLISPLVAILIVIITLLLPFVGLSYLGFKVYIWQRRLRGDQNYLIPVGIPGYPLG